MFTPDLSRFPWGRTLVEAAQRGPQPVLQEARKARRGVSFDESDAFGVELAELFHLNIDPPGRVGSLVCAAQHFGGPQTLAVVGSALRKDPCPSWKVERGLEIFKAHRGPEAIVQLLLCGRDACNVNALERCRAEWRGYPGALSSLLRHASVDAPAADLERYFALGLEQAMITGTRYPVDDLIEAARSGARDVLRRVVWARYDGRRPIEVFVIDPDEAGFIDRDYEPVVIDPDARVGVTHPAEFSDEFRDEWGRFLGDLEIGAPFPQFDRECRVAEDGFGYREIGTVVDHWDLTRFLFSRGWTRRDNYPTFEFSVRGAQLKLHTHLLANESARRIDAITLEQHIVAKGLENDVVHTEAVNESFAVLERFAPQVLYQ